jgi:hypothetical protein
MGSVLSSARGVVSVVVDSAISKCASSSLSFRSRPPKQAESRLSRQILHHHTTALVPTLLKNCKFVSLSCAICSGCTPFARRRPAHCSSTCFSHRVCGSSPILLSLHGVITASPHHLMLTTTGRNINHVRQPGPRANRQHRQHSHHGAVCTRQRSHGFRKKVHPLP